MSKSKNYLFIIPSLKTGGAEISTITLINKLISFDKKIKVHILTCNKNGELRKKINRNVKVIDLPYTSLKYCIFNISKYIRSYKPKVVFSIIFHCNIVTLISIFLSGHKCLKLISERQSTNVSLNAYNFLIRGIVKTIALFSYFFADKIITVSDGIRDELISIFPILKNKILTINNGFNLLEINKNSKKTIENKIFKKALSENKKILISCGRLVEEKDYFTLINTISILKNKLNFHLFILGEGPLREEIEDFIYKKHLNNYITLIGNVSNPYKYFSKADLFILSSKKEGLPGTLIQAILCGTQVISTNCKFGPSEILKNGKYGNLVKVEDPKELAKGILDQINNPKRFDINEVIRNYDIDNIFSKYKKLFNY